MRRHCIRCVRSPYIFRPIFKWIFWKQLRRNRDYYKGGFYRGYY